MARSRRLDQCVYKESRRRCIRSGTGDPPLCAPHKIAVEQAARTAERPRVGAGLAGIIDDLLNGRKIKRNRVYDALEEMAEDMMAGQFSGWPPSGQPGRPPPGRQGQTYKRAPPPVDPKLEAIRHARITLGFAASEPVTKERVLERRRELAKKHHPDRGGSVDRMQAVNAAVDVLLASM